VEQASLYCRIYTGVKLKIEIVMLMGIKIVVSAMKNLTEINTCYILLPFKAVFILQALIFSRDVSSYWYTSYYIQD